MYVITLARKPLSEPTVAATVMTHGTGALNIEDARIGTTGACVRSGRADQPNGWGWRGLVGHGKQKLDKGRWPANVILSREAADALEKTNPGCSQYFRVFGGEDE